MRRRRAERQNRNIMTGVVGMAIVVLLVAALFWYWCSPEQKTGETKKNKAETENIQSDSCTE